MYVEGPTGVLLAAFPTEVWDVVESIALEHPEFHQVLGMNKSNLSEEAWLSLYGTKKRANVGLALSLVDRPLTPAQRDVVLRFETRKTPLLKMLENQEIDGPEGRLVLARAAKLDPEILYAAFESCSDPGVKRELAECSGPKAMARWLFRAPQSALSDAEAKDLLANALPKWNWTLLPRDEIVKMLHLRPSLIDGLIADRQHGPAMIIAAGSRYVRPEHLEIFLRWKDTADARWKHQYEEMIGDLVKNPVVPMSFVEQIKADLPVDGGFTIRTALGKRIRPGTTYDRTISSRFEELTDHADQYWAYLSSLSPTRVSEMVALAHNPHLDLLTARSVREHLVRANAGFWLGQAESSAALTALGELFGELKMKPFVDRFSGPGHSSWTPDHVISTSLTTRQVEADTAVEYLAARLGTKRAAWETFFTLYPAIGGKTGDYVTTCLAVAS